MTRARAEMLVTLALVAAMASVLCAQVPPRSQASTSAAPQIPLGTRVGESPTTYDDGGRRDPFVSLIVPKATPQAANPGAGRVRSVAGLGGLSVSDVVVKGLIRSGTTLIALLQGPDGRTYMAKRQDRLQDGVVKSIEIDGVVFTERLADAAGVARTRDIRKPLRAAVSGSGGQS